MQVADIDVKQETPVGHGKVTCFSIYSGTSGAEADFGNGKTCIWVDVLDGGQDVLMEFAPFFEDSSIRKVNCSLVSHSFCLKSTVMVSALLHQGYCRTKNKSIIAIIHGSIRYITVSFKLRSFKKKN
jgi:hypothetical protein